MEIKKRDLKRLIENYLGDVGLGPKPGDAFDQAAIRTIEKGKKNVEYVVDLAEIAGVARPIVQAKEWAQIKDCDRYFHYLAFYTLVQELSDKMPDLKEKLIKLGELKEAIDYWGSTTAWWRVGEEASMKEFAKDMAINKQGIEDGIKVLRGEMEPGDVINKAYGFLEYIPSEKGIKNWSKPASDGSRPSYAYWFENRPDLYGKGKVFMHPVLNIKLSPDERKQAYNDLMGHVVGQGATSSNSRVVSGPIKQLRELGPFIF